MHGITAAREKRSSNEIMRWQVQKKVPLHTKQTLEVTATGYQEAVKKAIKHDHGKKKVCAGMFSTSTSDSGAL